MLLKSHTLYFYETGWPVFLYSFIIVNLTNYYFVNISLLNYYVKYCAVLWDLKLNSSQLVNKNEYTLHTTYFLPPSANQS